MRVIAGTARGRRLRAPAGGSVRPTADRVREAVFNMVLSRAQLDGAVAADLFAGTGAMGIEALSRGAAAVTFVDHDRRALALVRANLEATGLAGPAATVVQGDASRFLAGAGRFDVVFVDPPYAFDRWGDLFAHLDAGLVVAESDREVAPGAGWEVVKIRRYGGTVVSLVAPAGTSAEDADTRPRGSS